jgi:hypothetical protein
VGSYCYQKVSEPFFFFFFTKLILRSYSFDCAASAMAFDQENRMFYVGLNNGIIKRYQVNESYTKMQTLSDINAHTERVSGIFVDSKRKRLVT